MFRRVLPLLIAITLILPCAYSVSAQTAPGNDVTIDLLPENPGPNQSVTLTLQSYSFDLTTAEIEWSVDNQRVSGGVGKVSFTMTTKNLGVPSTVDVVITPASGLQITKKAIITPTSVDLLWEAVDSVVPPFYRGKALPTSEAKVKVVALPQIKSTNGTLIPPGSFLYNWEDQYIGDNTTSGYGKSSFMIDMDYLNPESHVDLSVSSLDGQIATTAAIDIDPLTPYILWYTANPLYGPLFDNALGDNAPVSGTETTLIAEPYFFTADEPGNPTTTYTWLLNNQSIDTPKVPNTLTLVRNDSSTGTAGIDLTISNGAKVLEQASSHLNLSLQK